MVGEQQESKRSSHFMQDVLMVTLSAGCLVLLSWAFISYTSRNNWGEFSDVPWYAGPPEWVAISVLIVLLFIHERVTFNRYDFRDSFSAIFLVWIISGILLGTSGMFIQNHVPVPVWFDEAVLFGTVTLGLTQLGMATIYRKQLCHRFLGLIAWSLAVMYGTIIVIVSIVMSFIFASSSFAAT